MSVSSMFGQRMIRGHRTVLLLVTHPAWIHLTFFKFLIPATPKPSKVKKKGKRKSVD